MRRRILLILVLLTALASWGRAQIVNRLRVDQPTFLRYAYCRMQEFNPDNLATADSLYREGMAQNNFRYKCLALSLAYPVHFAQGEYEQMDAAVAELKTLLADRKDLREFYFATLHEYCEFLLQCDRMPDAMLEARAMERLAQAEKKPVGKMYAYRIIGLIQSYRNNPWLAIENLEEAVRYTREARQEQDLPNLYILLAQENVKRKHFDEVQAYCDKAQEYASFFPIVDLKIRMTKALLYHAQGDHTAFIKAYKNLCADPHYTLQADPLSRDRLDITYLVLNGELEKALEKAGTLEPLRERLAHQQDIYARMGLYQDAYSHLEQLMNEKDSVYIKVQNEDLAILDAEMENAQLREEAQRLEARNQITILLGFLLMFALAFVSILVQQWRLRENLDQMRHKNAEMLKNRQAYRKLLDSQEAQNAWRIQMLQNRTTNILTQDYEDILSL